MTPARRAISGVVGVALLCGVAVLLLRPAPSHVEVQQPSARAKASERVRARLEQLRGERPNWPEKSGVLRQPAAAPVRTRATDVSPHGNRIEAPDTRLTESGETPPPGAEQEDSLSTLKQMALSDSDPDHRLAAITMLAATDDPNAPSILAQALSDRNEEVRMGALQALSDLTSEPPVDAIEDALRDPSPDIRFEALSLLADVGGERAHNAVEQALSDPDEDVRALAAGILDMESPQGLHAGAPQPSK